MTSSEEKPGRDIGDEHKFGASGASLWFNCYEFSRYMSADHRPLPDR
jgi:hypothetical protein